MTSPLTKKIKPPGDSNSNSLVEKHYKPSKSKKKFSSQLNYLDLSNTNKKSECSIGKRPMSSLLKNNNKLLLENSNDPDKKKTFYGVISNFYLSRKFINLLKNLTSKRTPKYLNRYHFEIMNDRSFFYEEYARTEMIKNPEFQRQSTRKINCFTRARLLFHQKFRQLSEEFGVFDINKSNTMIWNVFVGLSMLFFFVYVPMFICFQDVEIQQLQFFIIARYFCFLILMLDILKRLNTSFYKKGSLIEDRREIVQYYIRTQLLYDVLSLGPLVYEQVCLLIDFEMSIDSYTRFFTFLIYFKLRQFSYIMKKFEEMLFIDEVFHNILALLKLIFRILLLSHIFACLWYIVGTTRFYRDTWLTHYSLEDETAWIKYLYSYYYVCVTMNTVGYGDFTPQNPLEVVFAIVFIYFACGVFAYSLNSVGIIVNDLTKRSKELSKELNVINEFMNEKNVNFDLRMRVRNYLEYIFKEEKIEKVEEQGQIIKKLSDSIKEELLIEAHGSVIRDVKLFSLNFSEDTLRKTVLIMKEVRYTPGDIIFLQNDYANKDIYLIRKGVVELFIENDSHQGNNDVTIIKRLKEKDLFGEKSFFTNRERSVSARSCDFTTVYVINQEEFVNILKKSSKDFEKYCEIKDNINIYNDFSDLFLKCASCYQNTHLIDNCPLLHYLPADDIIIQRYAYTPLQERTGFKRNKKRLKIQTLANLDRIEKKVYQFQTDNIPKHDSEDEDESEDVTTYNSLSQKSNNHDVFTEEDDEMPEIKELDFEEEEKNGNLDNSEKSEKENIRNFDNNLNKRKIQRRSTKKTGIVLLNKSSTSKSLSKSLIEKSKSIDTNNSFNIESLENFDFKIEDSSSSSSIHANKKKISLQSFFMKLFEQVKINKQIDLPSKGKVNSEAEIKELVSNDQERSFDIDGIKCYEDYYSEGNVDLVLEKVEEFRKKRAYQKKMKKSRSIYNLFNLDNNHKERTKLYEGTATNILKVKQKNVMRRNFFKNARNLEKLIMEDQFDVEKFKAYYIKRYEKEQKIGCFGKIKRWMMSFLEKRRKQKVLISKTKSITLVEMRSRKSSYPKTLKEKEIIKESRDL